MAQEHSIGKLTKSGQGTVVFPGTLDKAVLFNETCGKSITNLGVWREFDMDTMFPLPGDSEYDLGIATREFWKKHLPTFKTETAEGGRLVFSNTPEDLKKGYNNFLDLAGMKIKFASGKDTYVYQFLKKRGELRGGDVKEISRMFKSEDSWYLVGGSKIIGDLDKKLNGIVDKMRQEAAGVVSKDRRFYVSGWIRNTGSPKDLSPTPEISYGDRTFLSDIWAHYLFDITSQGEEWGNRPVGKLKKNNLFQFEDGSYAPTVRVPQEWIDYTEKLKTKKIYKLSEKVPFPQLTYNDIPKEGSLYCDVGGFNVAKYLSEYDHNSPMDLYWLEEEEGESTLTEILEKEFEAIGTNKPFALCVDNPNSLLRDKKTRKYKTYKYVEYWKVTKPWETAETKYTIGLVNTKELYVLDNVQGDSGMIWSGIFLSPGIWDGIDYSQFKVPVTAQSPSPVLEDGCCIFNPRTDLPIFGSGGDFVIPDIIKPDSYNINITRRGSEFVIPGEDYHNPKYIILVKAVCDGDWKRSIDTSQIGIYWGSGNNLLSYKGELRGLAKPATGLMKAAYVITQELVSGNKSFEEVYKSSPAEKESIDSYNSWIKHGGVRVLKGLGNYFSFSRISYRAEKSSPAPTRFGNFGYSYLGNRIVSVIDVDDLDSIPLVGQGSLIFPATTKHTSLSLDNNGIISKIIKHPESWNSNSDTLEGKFKKSLNKLTSTPRIFDRRWMLMSRKFELVSRDFYRVGNRVGEIFFMDESTRENIISNKWTSTDESNWAIRYSNSTRFESIYSKFDRFEENLQNTSISNLTYVATSISSSIYGDDFSTWGAGGIFQDKYLVEGSHNRLYYYKEESSTENNLFSSGRPIYPRNQGRLLPRNNSRGVNTSTASPTRNSSNNQTASISTPPKPTNPYGIIEGIKFNSGYTSTDSAIAFITRKDEDIWYYGNIKKLHPNSSLVNQNYVSSYDVGKTLIVHGKPTYYYPRDQFNRITRVQPYSPVTFSNEFFTNKNTTPIEPCMFSQMAASYAVEKNIRPGDKFSFYCSGEYNKLWYDNVGGKNLLNEADGLFCSISVMCRRIPFTGTKKLVPVFRFDDSSTLTDDNQLVLKDREILLGDLKFNCYKDGEVAYLDPEKRGLVVFKESDLYSCGLHETELGDSSNSDIIKQVHKLGLEGISLLPGEGQQKLLDKHLLVSPRFRFLTNTFLDRDANICPNNIEQMMEVVFKYNVTGGLRLTSDTGLSYDRGSFYEVEQSGNKYSIKNYVQPKDEKILDDVQPMYLDYIKNTYRYVGKSILGTEIGSGGNVSYRSAWSSLPEVNNFSAPTSSSGDCHSCYVRSSGLSSYNIVVSQGRVNFPCATGRDDSYNPRNTEIYKKQDLGNSKTVLMMTSMKVTL